MRLLPMCKELPSGYTELHLDRIDARQPTD